MLAALVAISLSNLVPLISCHSLLIDTVVIKVYLLGKILSEFQILFSGEIPRSRIALSSGVTIRSPVLLAFKLPSSRAVLVHQHQLCWEAVCLPRLPPHSTAVDVVIVPTSHKRELAQNTFWPARMWSQTKSGHFDFFCLTNAFFSFFFFPF